MLKSPNGNIRVATMKLNRLTFFVGETEMEVSPEEAIEFAKEIVSNASHAAMKTVQVEHDPFDVKLVD